VSFRTAHAVHGTAANRYDAAAGAAAAAKATLSARRHRRPPWYNFN